MNPGARTAENILLLLEAGLAEVDVHVDEPRQHGETRAIYPLPRNLGGKFGDFAVLRADVEPLYARGRDDLCVFENHAISSFVKRNRMAMRTAMPEST